MPFLNQFRIMLDCDSTRPWLLPINSNNSNHALLPQNSVEFSSPTPTRINLPDKPDQQLCYQRTKFIVLAHVTQLFTHTHTHTLSQYFYSSALVRHTNRRHHNTQTLLPPLLTLHTSHTTTTTTIAYNVMLCGEACSVSVVWSRGEGWVELSQLTKSQPAVHRSPTVVA